MLDKSSVYNVLAEGMYFLGKSSPSTFNFLVKCKIELKVAHLKVLKREWKVGGGGGGRLPPIWGCSFLETLVIALVCFFSSHLSHS